MYGTTPPAAESLRRPRPSAHADAATCGRDHEAAEHEFMLAMRAYKASSGRLYPTWSEVLEVLQGLGYAKPSTPHGPSSPGDRPVAGADDPRGIWS